MMFGSFLLMPVYLMMAYTDISLYVPVAMMGIAFSLVPAVMWPSVAYIVDQSRLGTAYALMTLIQQIGFFAMNLLIGKANDYSHAGLNNPGGYGLGMWIFSILGFVGLTFAILLRIRETGADSHGLETITTKTRPDHQKSEEKGPPRPRGMDLERNQSHDGCRGVGKSLVDMRFGILPMAGGSGKFRVQPRKPYNVKIFISHLNRCGRERRLDRPPKFEQPSFPKPKRSSEQNKGTRKRLRCLYNLHKRRVYSLCLRMVANTAEAEDLAQEAFLQLFRKIGTFRGESAFSTWLSSAFLSMSCSCIFAKRAFRLCRSTTRPKARRDTQKRDYGADDLQLSGSIDRLQLQRAVDRLAPGISHRFLSSMTLRVSSTTKLPAWLDVRLEIASRNYTKHG